MGATRAATRRPAGASNVENGGAAVARRDRRTASELDDQAAWMAVALAEARRAGARGEVPVGAVVVLDGVVVARAGNASIATDDPTGHAEIRALRRAAKRVANYRLPGATLVVTLEPCVMCVGAMVQARIARLVYGATDPKAGAVESLYRLADDARLNHRCEVRGGVAAEASAALLVDFFRARRAHARAASER